MGVAELVTGIGNTLKGGVNAMGRSMTQEYRQNEQRLANQQMNAILQGHTSAMEIARQYGLPGSPEWADAYATIASQSGVPRSYIDQVRRLTVNPEHNRIASARENTAPFGRNYVNSDELGASPATTKQPTTPNKTSTAPTANPTSAQSLVDTVKKTLAQMKTGMKPQTMAGAMTRNTSMQQPAVSPVSDMVAGPAATASAIPRYVDSPRGGPAAGTPTATPVAQPSATPTPAAQPSAAKKSSWRDIISGIGKAFVTANGMSGASGMAGSPAAVASMANPNLDVVTGKEIPEDAVRAENAPLSLAEAGIDDIDTAEQFQDLEAMVGKSLPEGFDLKTNYAKRPEFYQKLFWYIMNGVPDQKNPGNTRKLSTQEILTAITKGQ